MNSLEKPRPKKNEDEEEIPTIVIDKDQDILDEHTEGKNGRRF